ncbi:MFS transporter [Spongiactinospora sp. TRM90649]|uniref:MFS transporter n=1 Tax=Spongiactinospora sp. TRM90649 TaxID=3031114 RepID=UPI0023FA2A7F|nr:MFS transporter [Spongiactinospora sp. TRM90649]
MVLAAAQIISGIGIAVGLALSAWVIYKLSGSAPISGLAGTASVLGAALLAVPAARAATRGGRRRGLALTYGSALAGSLVAVAGIAVTSWPLLLVGLVLMGGGSAGNLAARYSATDLSPPGYAGRHLSLVVWSATIGSVLGPNLAQPAEALGPALGLHPWTGPFMLAAAAFAVSLVVVTVALRPDPLVLARGLTVTDAPPAAGGARERTMRDAWHAIRASPGARRALAAIAVSHTAMVSVMSMTPVHLDHGGATVSVIGLVLSLHIAGMFALSPIVGWLADRLGGVRVLVIGMGLLLVSAVLAGTAGEHGVAQVTAGLFVLGVGWSCGLVAGSALLTESTPIARRTSVQGLSDLLMNVCGATGTVVAGAIVGALSYGALALAVGVMVTLCAALLLRRDDHLASA